ncbi:MAG: NifU N-terminal domain-containing protein [Candidatus Promineofilum sp.]|nr:NifU N-terminal domain-containing protein [Promineifilum sp.]
MSEYIDIETELGDNGMVMFRTNLKLTAAGGQEFYASADELEEGSPVAQALAVVTGIENVTISEGQMTIGTLPDADWHAVIADVTAALKDFFL